MTDYTKATDEQINAAIARLEGWEYNDWNLCFGQAWKRKLSDGNCIYSGPPPDYLHDPALWAPLPLGNVQIDIEEDGTTSIWRPYESDYDNKIPMRICCTTEGRARCLAYLAHKGGMEVEDE